MQPKRKFLFFSQLTPLILLFSSIPGPKSLMLAAAAAPLAQLPPLMSGNKPRGPFQMLLPPLGGEIRVRFPRSCDPSGVIGCLWGPNNIQGQNGFYLQTW